MALAKNSRGVSKGIQDYNCPDKMASSASFLAEEGIIYFILLLSSDTEHGCGGDFGLTIPEFEGAENDFCQRTSIVVIDNREAAGTTVGASGGSPSNECFTDPSIPDVWYFVDGNG
jgi:hypothetical protein